LLGITQKLLAECESKRDLRLDRRERLEQALAREQRLAGENEELKRQLKKVTAQCQAGVPIPTSDSEKADAPSQQPTAETEPSSEAPVVSTSEEQKPKSPPVDPLVAAQDIIKRYPCAALWVHKEEDGSVKIGGVTRSKKQQKRLKSALEEKNILTNDGAFNVRLIETNLCFQGFPVIPEHDEQWVVAFDKRDDTYAESIDDLTVAFQDIPKSAHGLLPTDKDACQSAGLALSQAAIEGTTKSLSASNAEIWAARGSSVILCRKDSWQSEKDWALRNADVSRKDAILVINISR